MKFTFRNRLEDIFCINITIAKINKINKDRRGVETLEMNESVLYLNSSIIMYEELKDSSK
jgi:hypothetical protein